VQVLIDTNIWSLALRRAKTDLSVPETVHAAMLRELISEDRAKLIGPVRQEVLSGIREQAQFDRLRNGLRSFPDEPLNMDDFEGAAHCSNRCRSKGISGSPIDFLICAVAMQRDWQIFTCDPDFGTYGEVLALRLLTAR
jgi:predicted nucleic acid-binding protein